MSGAAASDLMWLSQGVGLRVCGLRIRVWVLFVMALFGRFDHAQEFAAASEGTHEGGAYGGECSRQRVQPAS